MCSKVDCTDTDICICACVHMHVWMYVYVQYNYMRGVLAAKMHVRIQTCVTHVCLYICTCVYESMCMSQYNYMWEVCVLYI